MKTLTHKLFTGVLLSLAIGYVAVVLILPLAVVIVEASREGWGAFLAAIQEPDARSAIELTLLVAAIAVPINMVFGIAAAWAVTKHDFRGKDWLVSFIEVPFPSPRWSLAWSLSCCLARTAGLDLGSGRTISRSFSRCPALYWRLFSSPYPLSRVSSFR